jgi:hypothetical protein
LAPVAGDSGGGRKAAEFRHGDRNAIVELPWRCDKSQQIACFPRESCHWVGIVLTVAHLNHVAGDDRDENLKALCQWCHLNYDRQHHAETRSIRKDAARPLLAVSLSA